MIVNIALACLALAITVAVYRVLKGPSWGDRIMAFDFLTVNLAVLVVVLAVRTEITVLLDVALLVSILGFLSTVALARYLLRGRVFK